jgi:hypothetical protein
MPKTNHLDTLVRLVLGVAAIMAILWAADAKGAEPPEPPASQLDKLAIVKYTAPSIAVSDDAQVFRVIDPQLGIVCYLAAVDGPTVGVKDPIATALSCVKIVRPKKRRMPPAPAGEGEPEGATAPPTTTPSP